MSPRATSDRTHSVADVLRPFGWEYIVVDLCWFSPTASVHNYKQPGLEQLIDGYGRLIPDPQKFPSSSGGAGSAPWPILCIPWA